MGERFEAIHLLQLPPRYQVMPGEAYRDHKKHWWVYDSYTGEQVGPAYRSIVEALEAINHRPAAEPKEDSDADVS